MGRASSAQSKRNSSAAPQRTSIISRPNRNTLTKTSSMNSKSYSRARTKDDQKKPSEDFIFRALPLDRRVLDSCGDMGVPKIAKIPVTRPVSPNLSTARRTTIRRSNGNSSSGDESNKSSHDSDSDPSTCDFTAFNRQTTERRRSSQSRKPLRTSERTSSIGHNKRISTARAANTNTNGKRKLANKLPSQTPKRSTQTKQRANPVSAQKENSENSQ